MKKIVIYVCDEINVEHVKESFDVNDVAIISEMRELPSEFDYIIVFHDNMKGSRQMVAALIAYGVKENKILEYCYYEKELQISPIERYIQTGGIYHCDSLFLGMSHSFGGLNLFQLNHTTAMLSAPSMDLYYHYLVLKNVVVNNLHKIKYVYFDLPYYIFNYDISKCSNIFVQRMNFFYFFSDYHHYGECSEQKHVINSFEQINKLRCVPLYKKMNEVVEITDNRSYSFKILRKFKCAMQRKKPHIWTNAEIETIEQMKPHVWYKFHEETYRENLAIWDKICELLNGFPEIEWRIVVFPFVSYFQMNHKFVIQNMQGIFNNALGRYKDKVVDCFDCFMGHPEYFADECHLNALGRYKFSKLLNDKLSGRV